VTGEELEKLLADGEVRKVPVIIDLFATWCGPCLLLAEELDKVAKELGPEGVRIFKVDVDVEQALASQLQVSERGRGEEGGPKARPSATTAGRGAVSRSWGRGAGGGGRGSGVEGRVFCWGRAPKKNATARHAAHGRAFQQAPPPPPPAPDAPPHNPPNPNPTTQTNTQN